MAQTERRISTYPIRRSTRSRRSRTGVIGHNRLAIVTRRGIVGSSDEMQCIVYCRQVMRPDRAEEDRERDVEAIQLLLAHNFLRSQL